MNRSRQMAIVLILAAGWAAQAQAQAQGPAKSVYRCGNSYSQTPCSGGSEIQVDDARSAGQQKQTTDAARRDARSAQEMERDRLKLEGKAAPAVIPPPKADPFPEPVAGPSVTGAKVKKQKYFTAASPRKPKASAQKKAKSSET